MNLTGKTAIITGASSGIGAAAAKLFAREGAQLVLSGRRTEILDEIVANIVSEGGQAVALAGDVSDEAHANALVELALSRFGGLDIAFNNAGTLGQLGDIPSMTLENWNTVLQVNLASGFLGAKYQIPAMLARGGGSIIFTSSFVGHTGGIPGMSAYAASKAGLIGLTQCLAAEYGTQGIRVNALLPGGTRTPMADQFGSDADAIASVNAIHALGRQAAPEEIASAALFLASDASSFVTGSALLAEGGNSIRKF
jgi:NAD(P)-dependent dehydrogenase (short-subunit alcohol dehydrogenase family)